MIRFRADIEGLRAVAVLLVIFDHLQVPGFHGGFIGVDVFFVISGYLITSLLAAEYAKKADARHGFGSISISGFYLRRARRILPAALTVILAVLVASRLLLNQLRVEQIQHDALWALFFGSNINSINQATDYFAQGLAASPFQHYWSLAVEEQFYLVWPALFLLVVTMVHGLRVFGVSIDWRARVGITIGVLGTASLAWSVVATTNNPISAYFSTFTRAWELALGALIGISATRATQLSRRLATLASFAGAALLVIGCGLIDTSTTFPGVAALLPTLAAALFIVGGLAARPPLPNRVLSLAALRFLGRISYSLYLWHWPLIVFAAALYPVRSTEFSTRLLILALTLVVSILSFYLIEQPGRRISFTRSDGRRQHQQGWRAQNLGNVAFGTVALVALFAGVLSIIAIETRTTPVASEARPVAASVRFPDLNSNPTSTAATANLVGTHPLTAAKKVKTTSSGTGAYGRLLVAWRQKVDRGRSTRSVPKNLQPLKQHLTIGGGGCIGYRLRIVDHQQECELGNPDASRVAVITGDSHAAMWEPTLERALETGWRLHPFTRAWCGWSGGSENIAAEDRPKNRDCAGLQAQAISQVRALHPDLIVLSESGVRPDPAMKAALQTYATLAPHVVVLGLTPKLPNFVDCLSGAADISSCFGTLSESDRTAVGRERYATTLVGATYIDTTPWFCFGSRCPSVIDGAPAFADGSHLSAEMAEKLAPLLRGALRSAGVAP